MAKIVHFGLTAAAAFILATCGGNVLANNANADDTPERTASAGPIKVCAYNTRKECVRGLEVQGRKVLGYIPFR